MAIPEKVFVSISGKFHLAENFDANKLHFSCASLVHLPSSVFKAGMEDVGAGFSNDVRLNFQYAFDPAFSFRSFTLVRSTNLKYSCIIPLLQASAFRPKLSVPNAAYFFFAEVSDNGH